MTKIQKWVIGIFIALYLVTGGISTIHSIEFFKLANPDWLAVSLAAAFEIGAMACLAAIIVLDKTVRWMVWTLFILVTGVQILGNMYYSYSHLANFNQWSELFGLMDQDKMLQKRILSIITGGILPVVALGFIKSLVDVARPKKVEATSVSELLSKEDEQEALDETTSSSVDEQPITTPKPTPVEPIEPPRTESPVDTYVEPNPPQRFGPM